MITFNKEQIYIVTGASSGIGQATALLLNELGATVIGIGRNEARLADTKAQSKNPENFHTEIKDLIEDIENLPKYVKTLKEKYGKFSGLAYCAGITDVVPLKTLELDELQRVYDIDVFSPIFMLKGFADKRNNIGQGASAVIISSLAGCVTFKGMTSYCGAKAAIINSAKCIAKEYASQGLRVNTVSPSIIETPMIQLDDLKISQDIYSSYPFGIGKPNDVANMIIYLLSDKAKYLSGQNYIIDSGGVI